MQTVSKFELAVIEAASAEDTLADMLILTPVPPDEVPTAKAKAMTVRFGTRVDKGDKYQWCIGSSPTPSLDAVDAAITCLQSFVK